VAHRSKGVATFFHETMPGFSELTPLWDKRIPDRYLVVTTLWGTTRVFFHNVYAPVEDALRADFFSSLPTEFEDGNEGVHIVGGDFNLPMNAALDSTLHVPANNMGKPECLAWLAALRVTDAWRMMYPDAQALSGPGGRNRLDYLYLDWQLVARYLHSSVYEASRFRGDHQSHTTVLVSCPAPAPAKPTRAVWRLPRELLVDPKTVKALQMEAQQLLDELMDDPECNAGAKWVGWLRRMKKRLRQCQFNRHRHRAAALQLLQRRLVKSQTDARAGWATTDDVAAAKARLQAAKAECNQSHLDNGFDRHASMHETSSAYFLRKPPALKVPITSVAHAGSISTDPTIVAEVFTAHWRTIMTVPSDAAPPDPNIQEEVLGYLHATLTTDQRSALERPIAADELCSCIKAMRRSKSPGPDGWPVAFFQLAPELFAAILVRVFEYQRRHRGCLLDHQRTSSVTLLHKKGARSDPGNYRPIALMAVEVKVLSRVLARRLADVAPDLIHPSQAGFVKGRSMVDHVHLIQALQHKATRDDEEWFATFLDYAKAYDMVDQAFLFQVMRRMNIGSEFLGWVQLLYTRPQVHLLLDGVLGPVIRPTRGGKQGCPLSCLLFDMYLEPLGAMLRAHPAVGIPVVGGDALTGVFFADDSTLLSNSLESAEFQKDVLVGKFCAASGAALNHSKCVTLALNDRAEPVGRPSAPSIQLAPSGQPIRFLGAYVGHRLAPQYQAQTIHDKFLAAFSHWQCRARTIHGRLVLATSMILGLIWHVTAVTPIPDQFLVVWQRALNAFVVGNKADVTTRYQPSLAKEWLHVRVIGLGIPHIASTVRGQRLKLLQRVMRESCSAAPPAWAVLVVEQFGHCMQTVFRSSHPFDFLWYKPQKASAWLALEELHPMWLDVWTAWSRVSNCAKLPLRPTLGVVLSMPLWLTTYHDFLADGTTTAASLVSRCSEARQWCQTGASSGLRCLRDILMAARPTGVWPTFDQFNALMQSGSRAARVVIRGGTMGFSVVNYTRAVYTHVTCTILCGDGATSATTADFTMSRSSPMPFGRSCSAKSSPSSTGPGPWSRKWRSTGRCPRLHTQRAAPSAQTTRPPNRTWRRFAGPCGCSHPRMPTCGSAAPWACCPSTLATSTASTRAPTCCCAHTGARRPKPSAMLCVTASRSVRCGMPTKSRGRASVSPLRGPP